MIALRAIDNGITFAIRVRTRASRSQVVGEVDGALKVRLAAPPVDGEANVELIRLLAKLFDLPRSQVELLTGQTSKNKLVSVSGISREVCERILADALAGTVARA